ncbi:leukocyte surface antigen CD53 [Bicyclus anynana]|uniref:Tetraspanin n=1 Tax=Bicyclus anynana TaxID=110368 RepID=A0A6J1P628_BICAN|nr:leukocyte surface antigen CD53 [Bicyclus anynana]
MKINNSEEAYNKMISALQWLKTIFIRIWTLLSSIKFLISLITLALLVSGLSLLIVGILAIVTSAQYEEFLGISFFVLPIFAVVTASMVLCVAAMGWIAVKSKKYSLFSAYLASLVVILIFQIAIAIFGFKINYDIYEDNVINHKLYESRMGYYYGVDWDILQRELQCCGYDGVNDWGLNIPLSCCPMSWRGSSPFQCTKSNSYYPGCRLKLNWMLADYVIVLGITAATVTCLQGIIISMAACIAYKMKNQRQSSPYERKGLLTGTDYSQYHTIPGNDLP